MERERQRETPVICVFAACFPLPAGPADHPLTHNKPGLCQGKREQTAREKPRKRCMSKESARRRRHPCFRPSCERPRVVLHGEVEVVAQLLVRLAAVMERLEVAAAALEHGVAVHHGVGLAAQRGSGGAVGEQAAAAPRPPRRRRRPAWRAPRSSSPRGSGAMLDVCVALGGELQRRDHGAAAYAAPSGATYEAVRLQRADDR